MSGNCSTCFGWYHHLSSGAHTTVSTAFGICHTVTATCRYRERAGTGSQFQMEQQLLPAAIVKELELVPSSNSSTIAAGSSNGVTNETPA